MDQEAEATRRLLNVIPEDKLDWRPHAKARTLGELAMHVACVPGNVAALGNFDSKEAGTFPEEPKATSRAQIIEEFETNLKRGKEIVAATDDARAMEMWSLTKDGATLISMPRTAFWRSILLNHYYHHRGQLSAYVRELDVPMPSIYGPSADVNPFG
jgi:uncharacterized damage-inducible protein DinB